MFRRTLVRQARLCRPARISALPALSRPSGAALHRTVNPRAIAPLASLKSILATRAYSSAVTAESQVLETPAEQSQGPITKFADLASLGVHESLVRAITQGMGYESMTDVQSMTISPALTGKDIVAQAKTGTGKTLAFLLPVIQKILQDDPSLASREPGRFVRARPDDIRSIIISPTRELAEQIAVEAEKICRNTNIRVQRAVGGASKTRMLQDTQRRGCHLLVATPGRLLDLLQDEYSQIEAPKLTSLVLDEADRMLEVGFEKDLRQILDHLPDRQQQHRQTMLFSATIPKNVIQLARTYVDPHNFEFVQTVKADDVLTHEKVPQYIVPVKGYENYFPTLLELIERGMNGEQGSEPFKAIIFFQTTAMVELAASVFHSTRRLRHKLPYIYDIHSKKSQQQRTLAADGFRQAGSAILLSSDVTARGMDFPNVTHVIQVGVPPSREQYIHRLGRTGRARKNGQGWLIVAQGDVAAAREALPGLPIQRHTGLESADADLSQEDAEHPKFVELASKAMQDVGEGAFASAYLSHFGGVDRRDAPRIVEHLNNWALYGVGLEEPPAIPHDLAARRQLLGVPGVNIVRRDQRDQRDSRDSRDSRDYRDRSQSGPRRGGFQGRDSRGSFQRRDPFDRIASDRNGPSGNRQRRESRPSASF